VETGEGASARFRNKVLQPNCRSKKCVVLFIDRNFGRGGWAVVFWKAFAASVWHRGLPRRIGFSRSRALSRF